MEREGKEDQWMHYAIPESGQTKQKLNQRKRRLQQMCKENEFESQKEASKSGWSPFISTEMRCRHPSCTFECCFHFHFCSSSSTAITAPNTCSLVFVGSSSRRQATGEPAWLTSAQGLRRPQAAGSIADVSKWTGLNGFECAVNSQQDLAFCFGCIVVAISTL